MPHTPPPPVQEPNPSRKALLARLAALLYRLDAPIFASRWMLYIIHVGLTICLLIYSLKYAQSIIVLMMTAYHLSGEELMVQVLSNIDAAMVANLLVMINIGGYQIFIHKLHIDPAVRPQWLDHLDSMMMKVKVGVSIASITGVQVLRDFMDSAHLPKEEINERLLIHGVCLLSALAFAVIWRITREHQTELPTRNSLLAHKDGGHEDSHGEDAHDEHGAGDAHAAAHH